MERWNDGTVERMTDLRGALVKIRQLIRENPRHPRESAFQIVPS
jgi:hypothetical protein